MNIHPCASESKEAATLLKTGVSRSITELTAILAGEHPELSAYSIAHQAAVVGNSRPTECAPEAFLWYYLALDALEQRDYAQLLQLAEELPYVLAPTLTRTDLTRIAVAAPSNRNAEIGWRGLRAGPFLSGSWLEIGACLRHLPDGCMQREARLTAGPLYLYQAGKARSIQVVRYRDMLAPEDDPTRDDWCVVDALEAKKHVPAISAGMECLTQHWPSAAEEVLALGGELTLVRGRQFQGGSSVATFGVQYIGVNHEMSKFGWADHILHEAAHQWLHSRFEVDSALLNPDSMSAASPIRRDPRPLLGTFHAVFVFLRLTMFFKRVVEREPCLDAETRLHRHWLGLLVGYERLKRFARFSELGEDFFASVSNLVSLLRSELPDPDPQLYNAIAPDYERPADLPSAAMD